ncbi:MAG: hypothetical protein JXA25_02955 [Anaerolineales bacterium]|nr:hypothetical protein [Anaerolineales bacterium]
MQKILATPAGIQVQLTFWRMLVVLAEFALENKDTVQVIVRYAPILLWGSVAYILGWAAGGLLQVILF